MGLSKLTVYTLLLCCLLHGLPAFCQHRNLITIKETNVSLQQALQDIRAISGYDYLGESKWDQITLPVNLDVRDMPLDKVLELCFRNQPYNGIVRWQDGIVYIYVRPVKDRVVHGWVYNEHGDPLEGVSIGVETHDHLAAISSEKGEFLIKTHYSDERLVISYVNYETQWVAPEDGQDLRIVLKPNVQDMTDVVVLNTGYQQVRKVGSTVSAEVLDSSELFRRVSPSALSRIEWMASGVLFNQNTVAGTNPASISIRGRSTIFANPNPLVVIDNFPYYGDLNNINPDDIESVSILKDAAAASIWGAFSGNGVIVITTKKGRLNQAPKFSFNTSMTVAAKPNLYYQKQMSIGDYIDYEDTLFLNGFYDNTLNNGQFGVVSPAVEIYNQVRNGTLSQASAQTQLDALKRIDERAGLDKYFYRHALNSQYSLNVSGGGMRNQYYFSAGYDRNMSSLVRNEYNRVTLNGNNIYQLFPEKFELTTGFAFTSSKTYLNNMGLTEGAFYPYAQFADAKGNPLPIDYGYRMGYEDTAGGGNLLDWHYYPIKEIQNANNTSSITDYRVNIGLKYKVFKALSINGYYQLGHGTTNNPIYYSTQTWIARNQINQFAYDSAGIFFYPIPKGGILDKTVSAYTANNLRLQVNYNDSIGRYGRLNVIGGAEVRDIEGNSSVNWYYGYDPSTETSIPVNYTRYYSSYVTGQSAAIDYRDVQESTSERYFSYYINAEYTYRGRYILSGSARRDESNLFGVRTNQKGVPLWSVGGGWLLSKESFYRWRSWLPYLKLRVSDGYNGNVDRALSAFTTGNINAGVNGYGAVDGEIINPPNPNLRWERINTFNTGLDFELKGSRLGGSIEYFIKSGQDLIGQSPIDPTTGIDVFTGNTANMVVHGMDLRLQGHVDIGKVVWSSVLLFSVAKDRVTVYKQKLGAIQNYLNPTTLNPLIGHPLYSVYALQWKGLNSTGDAQGVLAGKLSTDYGNILGSTIISDLIYKGPVNPPYFGSWRNDISWHRINLSANLVYKFGYVFRRPSISYLQVMNHSSMGHPDYDKRWRQPGDEKRTSVPRLMDYLDASRDFFYQYAEVLIEKGGLIRLQDVQLSYDFPKSAYKTLPIQNVKLYIYVNNIGLIWRANHAGIDPDYQTGIPNPRTYAGGIKIDF